MKKVWFHNSFCQIVQDFIIFGTTIQAFLYEYFFLMIFKHCDIIEQVCIFFRLFKKKLSKLKCIVFEKTNDK